MGWLKDDYWLNLANHANTQAKQLEDALITFSELQLVWPRQANEMFLIMPAQLAEKLLTAGAAFYRWPISALPDGLILTKKDVFVRLVTSFATTDEHIVEFSNLVRDFNFSN